MTCPKCGREMEQPTGPPILADSNSFQCRTCNIVLGPSPVQRSLRKAADRVVPAKHFEDVSSGDRLVVDKHGNGKWVRDEYRPFANADEAAKAIASAEHLNGHTVVEIRGTPHTMVVFRHLLSSAAVENIRRSFEENDFEGKLLLMEGIHGVYHCVDGVRAIFQHISGSWQALPLPQSPD